MLFGLSLQVGRLGNSKSACKCTMATPQVQLQTAKHASKHIRMQTKQHSSTEYPRAQEGAAGVWHWHYSVFARLTLHRLTLCSPNTSMFEECGAIHHDSDTSTACL